MSDSLENEMDARQQMLAEKLAEIGVTVQLPVQFVKIPNGPVGGSITFFWEDSSKFQAAVDDLDEFAQITAAMKADEAAEREQARIQAEAEAQAELKRLADGILDDDDDDDE